MSVIYSIRGRKYLYLVFDTCIVVASYLFAYVVKFYPDLTSFSHLLQPEILLLPVACYVASFYLFQIYRIMWTYSNINDVYKMILSNVFGFGLFIMYVFFLDQPFSRIVMLLSFMFITAGTVLYRIIIRDYYSRKRTQEKEFIINAKSNFTEENERQILIIGAGEAGRIILSEYTRMGMGRNVVGFVDDDPYKIRKIFNGKMIFSGVDRIDKTIKETNASEIIIAMPSVGSETINRIVTAVRRVNSAIPIKILPLLMELIDNRPLSVSLREIGIVDLIGREEFTIDYSAMTNMYSGKTILITGAGGSIGSEICRQLLKFKIRKLVAVGRGEHSIFTLIKSLTDHIEFLEVKPEVVYKIADVKDSRLMDTVFTEQKPDIVFHAAAHKHVPLMEYNEAEAIQNNVLGTKNLLDLSVKHNIDEFVFISTDKAVHPANIMGASKRMAEMVTGYYHQKKGLNTAIVRFGNVIGSRGSVIPLFKEQILKMGPVTVTHPEVTRFFMSIPEASLLVINAAAYSKKGGEIFVLDMGKQYKVLDVAKRLIEFYGYEPEKDIKIIFSGLRPGEKMYEELFYSRENLLNTENKKIFVLDSNGKDIKHTKIKFFLENELKSITEFSPSDIRSLIKKYVPEYSNTDEPEDKVSLRLVT